MPFQSVALASFLSTARAQDEALNISGCSDVGDAASFFLDQGVGLVVVTRGASGALAMSRAGRSRGGSGGEGSGDAAGATSSGDDAGGGGGDVHRKWEQKCVPVEVRDACDWQRARKGEVTAVDSLVLRCPLRFSSRNIFDLLIL